MLGTAPIDDQAVSIDEYRVMASCISGDSNGHNDAHDGAWGYHFRACIEPRQQQRHQLQEIKRRMARRGGSEAHRALKRREFPRLI